MKQLLLDITPSPSPALDNFVPGHNRELLQTLDEIIAGKERFVYLWGQQVAAEAICYRQWSRWPHATN